MPAIEYLPHIDLLLQAMRASRERLNSGQKIALDARLLRLLIQRLVEQLPFSEAFYTATYPDIAAAAASGQITDLHRHFVETGFFEGRHGAPTAVDESFYVRQYPDVAKAIKRREVASATEHYYRSGAAEGRSPSATLKPVVDEWARALRLPTRGAG